MNILWICGASIVGGAERVTLQIGSLLRARGHRFGALCPPGSPVQDAMRVLGLPVMAAPIGGALNLRARGAITRALVEQAPDAALATGPDEWVWACLSRRGRTRLVLARHMALPLSRPTAWLAARRADAIVAVSHAVRDSLHSRARAREGLVHVIHNPVRFAPRADVPQPAEREGARRALNLPVTGRWVGFFAGLAPAKGLRDVAYALHRANRDVAPVRLLLCGRADDRRADQVRALTAEFDLADRVHDLGEIEHVEEAMTACDVVVAATHRRLSEALSATLVESMACGTPVLAYATGGTVEAIGDDQQSGRLARSDDREDFARVLVEILADPAAAERSARAALARVRERFDPQRAADRYEAVLERAGRGSGP